MSGFTSWSAANRSTRVALFQPAPSKQPLSCGSGVRRRLSCYLLSEEVRATSAPDGYSGHEQLAEGRGVVLFRRVGVLRSAHPLGLWEIL